MATFKLLLKSRHLNPHVSKTQATEIKVFSCCCPRGFTFSSYLNTEGDGWRPKKREKNPGRSKPGCLQLGCSLRSGSGFGAGTPPPPPSTKEEAFPMEALAFILGV